MGCIVGGGPGSCDSTIIGIGVCGEAGIGLWAVGVVRCAMHCRIGGGGGTGCREVEGPRIGGGCGRGTSPLETLVRGRCLRAAGKGKDEERLSSLTLLWPSLAAGTEGSSRTDIIHVMLLSNISYL